ncbi:ICOS ligand-like isoform X2 [Stegastes partitus]|uniref:ICOS ligand-like isoform X2 n=1 Tax=Stegastes partitus TaxID=144197 RepID=A0A9Y4KKN5_9TELE|nr:PREDICTED: ICOS ligand-like isoform X2 [Stegastes partitus]
MNTSPGERLTGDDTGEMAAVSSGSFCCLIVCFLLCTCTAQENITAELGQDVILPCGGPNNNDSFIAAEWVRPDQQPDYVLFYRDGKCHPQFQHPLFKNRTDLQDKQMKDGDVSLVLNDVKMEDTGTYVCRVFLKETIDRQSAIVKIVHLEVHPPGDKDGGDKDGGNVVGLVLGIVCYFLL